jgi:hypothetical protein
MKPIAILHEGNSKKTHDNELLQSLIKHLALDVTLVDFYGVGGKSNFFTGECKSYQELMPRIQADQVEKVLFVIDADAEKDDAKYSGYENTQQQIQIMIQTLGIQDISDFYITCNPSTKTGYLESLILSTIPEKQKQCITQFLSCSEFESKEHHKDILHRIYNLAYPKAPFNFEHPHFNELKDKLKRLFSEI